MTEFRLSLQTGSAAIAIGPGREVWAVNHLGPHNELEWAIYIGFIVVFGALIVREWRNRHTLPGFPERQATRPADPTSANASPPSGSDAPADDHDIEP
jgi:hypothetical protein